MTSKNSFILKQKLSLIKKSITVKTACEIHCKLNILPFLQWLLKYINVTYLLTPDLNAERSTSVCYLFAKQRSYDGENKTQ